MTRETGDEGQPQQNRHRGAPFREQARGRILAALFANHVTRYACEIDLRPKPAHDGGYLLRWSCAHDEKANRFRQCKRKADEHRNCRKSADEEDRLGLSIGAYGYSGKPVERDAILATFDEVKSFGRRSKRLLAIEPASPSGSLANSSTTRGGNWRRATGTRTSRGAFRS